MIVVCLGYIDKRPIIYALMKLFSSFGDVAVISQNRQLKRLLNGREDYGYYNNIYLEVTDTPAHEVLDRRGYNTDDFDNIIIDSIDQVPKEYDICIYNRGYKLTEYEKKFISGIDDLQIFNFTYGGKLLDECTNIPITFKLVKSIENFEAGKVLAPIRSKKLLQGLSNLIATQMKISEKDTFKILKRGWNER